MAGADSREPQRAETIRLDDILRQEGALASEGRELAPLTRAGYKLGLFILAYLAGVTLLLFVDYFNNAPSLPKGACLDSAQIKLYQELSQLATDRMLRLLDAFVLKGFLPVLTAVLGYIFGSGGDRE